MVAAGSCVLVVMPVGRRVGVVTEASPTGYYAVHFPGEPRPVYCTADSVSLADGTNHHECRECGYLDECPKWCTAPASAVEPSIAAEDTNLANPDNGASVHKNTFDLESLQQAVNATAPSHYRLPSGIECWDVIDELGMGFLRGSAFDLLWRAGRYGDAAAEIADLRMAKQFIEREIARLEAEL